MTIFPELFFVSLKAQAGNLPSFRSAKTKKGQKARAGADGAAGPASATGGTGGAAGSVEGSQRPLPQAVKLSTGLVLSVIGGVGQTLAWPKFGLWPLTFVCLVFLWRALFGQTFKRAFLMGWVYGLALGLSGFYWLAEVMAGYGGLGAVGGFLVLLILAAFLALHQGLWAGLMAAYSTRIPPLDSRLLGVPMLGAFLWAGFDYLKNFLLTGFNWTPLAGGLSGSLEFIGAADLIGVYGLNFPVALIGLLLAQTLTLWAWPKIAWSSAISALLLAGILYGYGYYRLSHFDQTLKSAPSLNKTVAILQASVPQDEKWDVNFRDKILSRFTLLLENAVQQSPWLVIWPETAVPFIYGLDPIETAWMDETVKNFPRPMLVGLASGDYDPDGTLKLHNRSWLVSEAKVLGSYDKSHLVPFGEYVPLADILPFLKWPFLQGVLGAAGTYSPGRPRPPLILDGVQIGQLICFESIFPYLARARANAGAKRLVVTTNDAWFGLTMAPDQHLAQSVMRAVETRLPLVRGANNGISAVINPAGRLLNRSVQNEITTLAWPVQIPQNPEKTLFTRGGHFLAPFMGLLTAMFCLFKYFRRRHVAAGRDLWSRKTKRTTYEL
ncbi:MAG: apolipoprotein N-acyltransferase [Deltaproteobacteria bacterium]|nr:apolipoprotein N-acyltransferase [Deltaproteobacteria bacterium]